MAGRALLDTCVLYPAYLRDTILRLAEADLFHPLWSATIFEELHRNLTVAGIPEVGVARMLAQMRATFDEANVMGYERLVESMTCDKKDRHVLAAAVHGQANVLVTFNVRDFPVESVEAYPLEVVTPDDFLLDILDLDPAPMVRTLHTQAASYKREPRTMTGLLTALSRAGAPRFVAEIRRHAR